MFLAVLGVGLLAIILVLMIKEYDMKRVLLIFGMCLLLFIGFFVTVFMNLEELSKGHDMWQTQYVKATEETSGFDPKILVPGAEDCFECHSFGMGNNPDYILETDAYRSIESLCGALPKGYEKAILEALDSSPSESEDFRGKKVKQYKVNSELLPIKRQDEIEECYDYYFYVNKYVYGTFRFIGVFKAG